MATVLLITIHGDMYVYGSCLGFHGVLVIDDHMGRSELPSDASISEGEVSQAQALNGAAKEQNCLFERGNQSLILITVVDQRLHAS